MKGLIIVNGDKSKIPNIEKKQNLQNLIYNQITNKPKNSLQAALYNQVTSKEKNIENHSNQPNQEINSSKGRIIETITLDDLEVEIEKNSYFLIEEPKPKEELKISKEIEIIDDLNEDILNKNVNNSLIKEEQKSKEEPKSIKTKKKNTKKIISFILFIVSLDLLFLYIANQDITKHQPIIEVKEVYNHKTEEIIDQKLVEIQKLYEENNDLVGWLEIENTNINYPVMYTKGEDFYLRRDFYKKYYTAGSLYINKNNTLKPRDSNLIIYGHNMRNGTMFADLLKYKEESYYKEHKRIIYYTLEEKEEYEIIAVFLSKVYNVDDDVFKYYQFYGEKTQEEYKDFIANIKNMSLYPIELSSKYPEPLLTLSTCEYSQEDGRLVVVAKKIN